MSDLALSIEHLSKSYGDFKAVDDISLSVKRGALFAFLGVNGAGKSTTINIICSILPKDGGKVYVGGRNLDEEPEAIKRETGIVFQTSVLDRELTVKENLSVRTSFYSLSRAEKARNMEEIVRLLELEPIWNRAVKNLSGGQLRRVDIARAMVHKPRLLILDEPTTGLDPKTRLSVWSLIGRLRAETGMTVFLTTHYLEEADKASDVVIMDRGHIIAHGTPNELKNAYSSDRILAYGPRDGELERMLSEEGRTFSYLEEREALRIDVSDAADAKEVLARCGERIRDFELLKGDMDDVFLNVTGKSAALSEEGGES